MNRKFILLFAAMLLAPVAARAQYTFKEVNGVVSIEAEHPTSRKGPWQEYADQNGTCMLISKGNWEDHLAYRILFDKPGTYNVWLFGTNGGDDGASQVRVFFDTDPITPQGKNFSVVFDSLGFWQPQDRKPGMATIEVPAKGWHTLFLVKGDQPTGNPPATRKQPNWRVDRILLYQDNTIPDGSGPVETLYQ